MKIAVEKGFWIFEFESATKFILYSEFYDSHTPTDYCTYNPIDNTIFSISAQDDYDPYTIFITDYSDDGFVESFKEAYIEYKKLIFKEELKKVLGENE